MRIATRSMRAFATTATVAVTDPASIDEAALLVSYEVEDMDLAASRFRPDSELMALCAANGDRLRVGPLLFEAVLSAMAVADWTDGAVDPTVGRSVEAAGYDRDFALIARTSSEPEPRAVAAPGWQSIEVDFANRALSVAPGSLLDLGATAKALSADRAACSVARRIGCGALVSIGGDVAVSGPPPPGGWAIGISRSSATRGADADQVVSIRSGGIASSGTGQRCWRRGGRTIHHIVDPWTGETAPLCWDVVSVAGRSCVLANAASTAAIVWGSSAPDRLESLGVAARLVSTTGLVTTIGGWPKDDATQMTALVA